MKINYRDYLLKSSEDKVVSSLAITDPRSIGNTINLDYVFELKHDLLMLEEQAEVFLNEFRRNPKLCKELDTLLSLNYRLREQYIKNTYIYSYFKAMIIIKKVIDNGFRSVGILPDNSYLYYGHKKLVYTFLKHNISSHNVSIESSVIMQKLITYDFRTNFKILEESEYYKSFYNEYYPFDIFSPDCERILEILSNSDSICVERLDNRETVSNDSRENPLGNMCFVVANKQFGQKTFVNTVNIRESLTDHVSKFWNIANCVYLKTLDEKFDDEYESPYFSVNKDKLSKSSYFAMVESITGLKCGVSYSSYGSPSIQGTPKDNSDKPSGNPSNPSPKSKSQKYKGPKDRTSVDKIVRDVTNVFKKIGSVATSDQAKSLLTDTARLYLQRELKRDEINSYMDLLKKQNIRITDRQLNTNLPFIGMSGSEKQLQLEDKK